MMTMVYAMGGVLAIMLVVLFVLTRVGGGWGLNIQQVPAGEDWTTYWRRYVREKRAKRPMKTGRSWLFLGAGVGIMLVGLILAFLMG